MKNKIAIYIGIAILAIIGAFFLFRPKTTGKETSAITLFSRYDCPHCQNVETYIRQNKIEEKIKFEKKEIHESANANLLLEKAKLCAIPEDQIGVPLLFDGQKCYIGDQDIINYFIENTK